MLKRERGFDIETIDKLADGSNYGPAALSDDERKRLEAADMTGAPNPVAGDYPDAGAAFPPGRSATRVPRRAQHWPRARRSICASIH